MLPDVRSVSESNGLNGIYLTLVNDIVYPDGTESQKDPALVTMLTADRAVRGAHIDEIVAAAVSYGFDGIELDYERVGEKDWPNFVQLVRELQTRLKSRRLGAARRFRTESAVGEAGASGGSRIRDDGLQPIRGT